MKKENLFNSPKPIFEVGNENKQFSNLPLDTDNLSNIGAALTAGTSWSISATSGRTIVGIGGYNNKIYILERLTASPYTGYVKRYTSSGTNESAGNVTLAIIPTANRPRSTSTSNGARGFAVFNNRFYVLTSWSRAPHQYRIEIYNLDGTYISGTSLIPSWNIVGPVDLAVYGNFLYILDEYYTGSIFLYDLSDGNLIATRSTNSYLPVLLRETGPNGGSNARGIIVTPKRVYVSGNSKIFALTHSDCRVCSDDTTLVTAGKLGISGTTLYNLSSTTTLRYTGAVTITPYTGVVIPIVATAAWSNVSYCSFTRTLTATLTFSGANITNIEDISNSSGSSYEMLNTSDQVQTGWNFTSSSTTATSGTPITVTVIPLGSFNGSFKLSLRAFGVRSGGADIGNAPAAAVTTSAISIDGRFTVIVCSYTIPSGTQTSATIILTLTFQQSVLASELCTNDFTGTNGASVTCIATSPTSGQTNSTAFSLTVTQPTHNSGTYTISLNANAISATRSHQIGPLASDTKRTSPAITYNTRVIATATWTNISYCLTTNKLSGTLTFSGADITSIISTDFEILDSSNTVQTGWTFDTPSTTADDGVDLTISVTPPTNRNASYKFRLKATSVRSDGSAVDNAPASASISTAIAINNYPSLSVSSFTAPSGTQTGSTSTFILTLGSAVPKTEITTSDFTISISGITLSSVTGQGLATTATIFNVIVNNPSSASGSYTISLSANTISAGTTYTAGPSSIETSGSVTYDTRSAISRSSFTAPTGTQTGTTSTFTLTFGSIIPTMELTSSDFTFPSGTSFSSITPTYTNSPTNTMASVFAITVNNPTNLLGSYTISLSANAISDGTTYLAGPSSIETSESVTIDTRSAISVSSFTAPSGTQRGTTASFTLTFDRSIPASELSTNDFTGSSGICIDTITIFPTSGNQSTYIITVTQPTRNSGTYTISLKANAISATTTYKAGPTTSYSSAIATYDTRIRATASWGTPTFCTTTEKLSAALTFNGAAIAGITVEDFEILNSSNGIESGWNFDSIPTTASDGTPITIGVTPPSNISGTFRLRLKSNSVQSDGSSSNNAPVSPETSTGILIDLGIRWIAPSITGQRLSGIASTNNKLYISNNTASWFGIGEYEPESLATDGTTTWFTGRTNNALYTLNLTTAQGARIGSSSNWGVNETGSRGLTYANSKLYMVGSSTNKLYEVNTGTGVATVVDATTTNFGVNETEPQDLASNGSTIYMLGGSTNAIYTLDTSNGTATIIGSSFATTENKPRGIAHDGTNLYMVGNQHNALYTIDTGTGAITRVPSSSPPTQFGSELTKPKGLLASGTNLYMLADNLFGSLWTLNKNSGIATLNTVTSSIRRFTPTGTYESSGDITISTPPKPTAVGSGYFYRGPDGLAIYNNKLYILTKWSSGTNSHFSIEIHNFNGTHNTNLITFNVSANYVDLDIRDDQLFITDGPNKRVYKYNLSDGTLIDSFSAITATRGIRGIGVSGLRIYVFVRDDSQGNQIRAFNRSYVEKSLEIIRTRRFIQNITTSGNTIYTLNTTNREIKVYANRIELEVTWCSPTYTSNSRAISSTLTFNESPIGFTTDGFKVELRSGSARSYTWSDSSNWTITANTGTTSRIITATPDSNVLPGTYRITLNSNAFGTDLPSTSTSTNGVNVIAIVATASWSSVSFTSGKLQGTITFSGASIVGLETSDFEILSGSTVQTGWIVTLPPRIDSTRTITSGTGTIIKATPPANVYGSYKLRLKMGSVRSGGAISENAPATDVDSSIETIDTRPQLGVSSFTAPSGTQTGTTADFTLTFDRSVLASELTTADFTGTNGASITSIATSPTSGETNSIAYTITVTQPTHSSGTYTISLNANAISASTTHKAGPTTISTSTSVTYNTRVIATAAWSSVSYCSATNKLSGTLTFSGANITGIEVDDFEVLNSSDDSQGWTFDALSSNVATAGSGLTISVTPSANTTGSYKLRLEDLSVRSDGSSSNNAPVSDPSLTTTAIAIDNRPQLSVSSFIAPTETQFGTTANLTLTFNRAIPASELTTREFTGTNGASITSIATSPNSGQTNSIAYTITVTQPTSSSGTYTISLSANTISATTTYKSGPTASFTSDIVTYNTITIATAAWTNVLYCPDTGKLRGTLTFSDAGVTGIAVEDFEVLNSNDDPQGWTFDTPPTLATIGTGITISALATGTISETFRLSLKSFSVRSTGSPTNNSPTAAVISTGVAINLQPLTIGTSWTIPEVTGRSITGLATADNKLYILEHLTNTPFTGYLRRFTATGTYESIGDITLIIPSKASGISASYVYRGTKGLSIHNNNLYILYEWGDGTNSQYTIEIHSFDGTHNSNFKVFAQENNTFYIDLDIKDDILYITKDGPSSPPPPSLPNYDCILKYNLITGTKITDTLIINTINQVQGIGVSPLRIYVYTGNTQRIRSYNYFNHPTIGETTTSAEDIRSITIIGNIIYALTPTTREIIPYTGIPQLTANWSDLTFDPSPRSIGSIITFNERPPRIEANGFQIESRSGTTEPYIWILSSGWDIVITNSMTRNPTITARASETVLAGSYRITLRTNAFGAFLPRFASSTNEIGITSYTSSWVTISNNILTMAPQSDHIRSTPYPITIRASNVLNQVIDTFNIRVTRTTATATWIAIRGARKLSGDLQFNNTSVSDIESTDFSVLTSTNEPTSRWSIISRADTATVNEYIEVVASPPVGEETIGNFKLQLNSMSVKSTGSTTDDDAPVLNITSDLANVNTSLIAPPDPDISWAGEKGGITLSGYITFNGAAVTNIEERDFEVLNDPSPSLPQPNWLINISFINIVGGERVKVIATPPDNTNANFKLRLKPWSIFSLGSAWRNVPSQTVVDTEVTTSARERVDNISTIATALWSSISYTGGQLEGTLLFTGANIDGIVSENFEVLNISNITQTGWNITVPGATATDGTSIIITATPPANTNGSFKLRLKANSVSSGGSLTENAPSTDIDSLTTPINNRNIATASWTDEGYCSESNKLRATLTFSGSNITGLDRSDFEVLDSSDDTPDGWIFDIPPTNATVGNGITISATPPPGTIGMFRLRINQNSVRSNDSTSNNAPASNMISCPISVTRRIVVATPTWLEVTGGRALFGNISFNGVSVSGIEPTDFEVISNDVPPIAQIPPWPIFVSPSAVTGDQFATIIAIPPNGTERAFKIQLKANSIISGGFTIPTTEVTSKVIKIDNTQPVVISTAIWSNIKGGLLLTGELTFSQLVTGIEPEDFEVLSGSIIQTGWTITISTPFIISGNTIYVRAIPPDNTNGSFKIRLKALSVKSDGSTTNNAPVSDLSLTTVARTIQNRPQLTVTSFTAPTGVQTGTTATFTLVLNHAVPATQLTPNDFTIPSGALISAISPSTDNQSIYTIIVTQPTHSSGTYTISLNANVICGTTSYNAGPTVSFTSTIVSYNTRVIATALWSSVSYTSGKLQGTLTFTGASIVGLEITDFEVLNTFDTIQTGWVFDTLLHSTADDGVGITIAATPPDDTNGSYKLRLKATSVQSDGSSSNNAPVSHASLTTSAIVVDVHPRLTASFTAVSSIQTGATVNLRLTFNHAVPATELTTSDFTVTNETIILAISPTSGNSSVYTITVTQPTSGFGTYTISLKANSISGNPSSSYGKGPLPPPDPVTINYDIRSAISVRSLTPPPNQPQIGATSIFRLSLSHSIPINELTISDFISAPRAIISSIKAINPCRGNANEYNIIINNPIYNSSGSYSITLKADTIPDSNTYTMGPIIAEISDPTNYNTRSITIATAHWSGIEYCAGTNRLSGTIIFNEQGICGDEITVKDFDVISVINTVQTGWTLSLDKANLSSNGSITITAIPPSNINNRFALQIRALTIKSGGSSTNNAPAENSISPLVRVNNTITPISVLSFTTANTVQTDDMATFTLVFDHAVPAPLAPNNFIGTNGSLITSTSPTTGNTSTYTITVRQPTHSSGTYTISLNANAIPISTTYRSGPINSYSSTIATYNTFVTWYPVSYTSGKLQGTITFSGSSITDLEITDFQILDNNNISQDRWTVELPSTITSSSRITSEIIKAIPPVGTTGYFKFQLNSNSIMIGSNSAPAINIISNPVEIKFIEWSNISYTSGKLQGTLTFNGTGTSITGIESTDFSVLDSSNIPQASWFGRSDVNPESLATDGNTIWFIGDTTNALYTLDLKTFQSTRIGTSCNWGVNETSARGLTYANDKLYMVGSSTNKLYEIATTTGIAIPIGTSTNFGVNEIEPQDLASDLSNTPNIIYMLGGSTNSIYILNTNDGTATIIGSPFTTTENDPKGIAYDGTNLYMVGSQNDVLYTIDTSSGLVSTVGSTFRTSINNPKGLLAIGTDLYLLADDCRGSLWSLNKTDGTAHFSAWSFDPILSPVSTGGNITIAVTPPSGTNGSFKLQLNANSLRSGSDVISSVKATSDPIEIKFAEWSDISYTNGQLQGTLTFNGPGSSQITGIEPTDFSILNSSNITQNNWDFIMTSITNPLDRDGNITVKAIPPAYTNGYFKLQLNAKSVRSSGSSTDNDPAINIISDSVKVNNT